MQKEGNLFSSLFSFSALALYHSSRDCFNAASIIIMGNYGSIFYWVFQVRSRKEEGRSLNRGDGLRN